ncbi:hypothetical protein D039_0577B, partial [Vibrio parahaemolyticus EKP-028]
QPHCRAE